MKPSQEGFFTSGAQLRGNQRGITTEKPVFKLFEDPR
jgi:hypothetical protein